MTSTSSAEPEVAQDHDSIRTVVELAVVGAVTLFVLWRLRPSLLLTNTLPAGGDLSAHSWGPHFLRQSLLPRPSGWSWDWLAGFPAFQFYPALPALLVVALDVVLPYGIAMKLVIASGLLALPCASWFFARAWRLPSPTAPLVAVGALAFLFQTNVFGANVLSTISGEYSYALGFVFAVVALGVFAFVVRDGRYRVTAACAFAAAALAHPLAAEFAFTGIVAIVAMHVDREWRRLAARVLPVVAVAAALAGIWWVPFALRHGYMTSPDLPRGTGIANLLPFGIAEPFLLASAVAAVVLGWQAGRRVLAALAVVAAVNALLYLVLPLGQLQNTRLVPYWSWSRLALAAAGIAELAVWVAHDARPSRARERARRALLAAPVAALVVVVLAISIVWKVPPFGHDGEFGADRDIEVAFEGYQHNSQYPAYHALMSTMARLGHERGCGRFLWSVDVHSTDFGTVSNELAPYWTNGCITTLPGLYYDSSTTTPYISLTESLTGIAPQRFAAGVPYRTFDLEEGVRHLQYAGVRYYAARTAPIVAAADARPELTPLAVSGEWHIYEVARSQLVSPLHAEPVVFAIPASNWKTASATYTEVTTRWDQVLLAKSGPASWRRLQTGTLPPDRPLAPVRVGAIRLHANSLSFHVDRTRVPVLVKTSYFPTWKVEGGLGPYRVAGNMMVVVPTQSTVRLVQTLRLTDWLAYVSFVAGVIGGVILYVSDRRGARRRLID